MADTGVLRADKAGFASVVAMVERSAVVNERLTGVEEGRRCCAVPASTVVEVERARAGRERYLGRGGGVFIASSWSRWRRGGFVGGRGAGLGGWALKKGGRVDDRASVRARGLLLA